MKWVKMILHKWDFNEIIISYFVIDISYDTNKTRDLHKIITIFSYILKQTILITLSKISNFGNIRNISYFETIKLRTF